MASIKEKIVIDLETQKSFIRSVEMDLLSWSVPASQMVPIAEETGLFIQVWGEGAGGRMIQPYYTKLIPFQPFRCEP